MAYRVTIGDIRCWILHGQVRSACVLIGWACCYRAMGSNGRPISGAVSYARRSNDAHDTSNRWQSQSAALLVTQRVQSAANVRS